MADYQRFVSYIYSYPGGVKDKNVGFAKVGIKSGEMHLNINLRGVYTDTPQIFGVHMLIDRDDTIPGRYRLMKVGDCVVNNGIASYSGIFNASNIDNTGYTYTDICGIAIANKGDRYYMMFSMWEDYDINPDVIEFAGGNVRKYIDKNTSMEKIKNESENKKTGVKKEGNINTTESIENSAEENKNAGFQGKVNASEELIKMEGKTSAEGILGEKAHAEKTHIEGLRNYEKNEEVLHIAESREDMSACVDVVSAEDMNNITDTQQDKEEIITERMEDKRKQSRDNNEYLYKKLYSRADYVDAFDDDYFYDCIEVTPQMLSRLPLKDKEIINNSFLIHGYYNFHHLLFGRVCDNENNTNYFIGVPGMYCNRERYMASMFGFNNFKKSHRSDYNNPYFGYWYQEI